MNGIHLLRGKDSQVQEVYQLGQAGRPGNLRDRPVFHFPTVGQVCLTMLDIFTWVLANELGSSHL